MREERLFAEEALLRSAVETPVLSIGLRSRVLAVAFETRRRRARARRMLWGAGLFFAFLLLSGWCNPLSFVSGSLANWGLSHAVAADAECRPAPPVLVVSQRYERGEWLVSAGGDDWGMVEAEARSRCVGLSCLAISF